MEVSPTLVQECDKELADAVWGGLCLGIGAELLGDAKVDLAQDVQEGVIIHHAGEDLRHIAEVDLRGTLLDPGTVGLQRSHTDAVGKNMEVWDGV